jgi:hypothetical protein
MLTKPHDGTNRRWLSIEGPFLVVYKTHEDYSARAKPRAIVSLSSFAVHRTGVGSCLVVWLLPSPVSHDGLDLFPEPVGIVFAL